MTDEEENSFHYVGEPPGNDIREQITRVTIAPHIDMIWQRHFWGCRRLRTIIIPPHLKTICRDAFVGCNNLDEESLLGITDLYTGKIRRRRGVLKKGSGPTHDFQGHTQKGWGPEWWGITLEQIYNILEHPSINFETTMRDVVRLVIKPATKDSGLGFALMRNQDKPLKARVIVSHAWDVPIGKSIQCLQNSGEEGPFWISAFSVYQSDDHSPTITEQLGPNPEYGPVSTVLKGVDCLVAIVTKEYDIFTRIWCLYEISLAQKLNVNIKLSSIIHDINVKNGNLGRDDCIPNVDNPVDSKNAVCTEERDKEAIHTAILSQSQNGFEEVNAIIEEIRLQYLLNYSAVQRVERNRKEAVELLASKISLIVERVYSFSNSGGLPNINNYLEAKSESQATAAFDEWKKDIENCIKYPHMTSMLNQTTHER